MSDKLVHVGMAHTRRETRKKCAIQKRDNNEGTLVEARNKRDENRNENMDGEEAAR